MPGIWCKWTCCLLSMRAKVSSHFCSRSHTWLMVDLTLIEEHLSETLGIFGGPHIDRYDVPGGFTAMISNCDIPDVYEPGRFHILELGVYIILDSFVSVYFSGLRVHGGTSPIGPKDSHQCPGLIGWTSSYTHLMFLSRTLGSPLSLHFPIITTLGWKDFYLQVLSWRIGELVSFLCHVSVERKSDWHLVLKFL